MRNFECPAVRSIWDLDWLFWIGCFRYLRFNSVVCLRGFWFSAVKCVSKLEATIKSDQVPPCQNKNDTHNKISQLYQYQMRFIHHWQPKALAHGLEFSLGPSALCCSPYLALSYFVSKSASRKRLRDWEHLRIIWLGSSLMLLERVMSIHLFTTFCTALFRELGTESDKVTNQTFCVCLPLMVSPPCTGVVAIETPVLLQRFHLANSWSGYCFFLLENATTISVWNSSRRHKGNNK